MKHIFILNPAAGRREASAQAAAAIRKACADKALDHALLTTRYPRHAVELVKETAARFPGQPLRFYACGGDGTLNEVAAGAAGLDNASVAHFPCGSGNDFIRLFGGSALFRVPENLAEGRELPVDYMESDWGVCLNVFSVGVDARVAAGMGKYKRLPLLGGSMAYNLSTAEQLLGGLHEPYRVEIDGAAYDGRYTLILAGNGRFYGGGFCPVPEADPTDGLLDVLLIGPVSLLTAARVIGAYKAGRHRHYPQYITHLRAKALTIAQPEGRDLTINLDGEIVRAPRVSLRVAPHKLRFVVPQGQQLLPPRTVE